jgi:hypothetical protein
MPTYPFFVNSLGRIDLDAVFSDHGPISILKAR